MATIIAGVGYTNLRDISLGPELVPALRQMEWPPGTDVEDWSMGPFYIVHQLQARPGYYDRVVLVSAVGRGREPGSVHCYRWSGELPDDEQVQERVSEAVTGIISLDNLLIIAERFGALPRDVVVVEVEPEDSNWGPGFTPCVQAALGQVIETVRRVVVNGYAE